MIAKGKLKTHLRQGDLPACATAKFIGNRTFAIADKVSDVTCVRCLKILADGGGE